MTIFEYVITIASLIFLSIAFCYFATFFIKKLFEEMSQFKFKIESFLAIRRYEKEKREFFRRTAEENAKDLIRLKDKGAE